MEADSLFAKVTSASNRTDPVVRAPRVGTARDTVPCVSAGGAGGRHAELSPRARPVRVTCFWGPLAGTDRRTRARPALGTGVGRSFTVTRRPCSENALSFKEPPGPQDPGRGPVALRHRGTKGLLPHLPSQQASAPFWARRGSPFPTRRFFRCLSQLWGKGGS